MSKRSKVGPQAISAIIAAYEVGTSFKHKGEIADHLARSLGISKRYLPLHKVGGWEREARHEMHLRKQSVTSPVGSNRYLRDPGATAEDRIASRRVRDKSIATQVSRRVVEAESDGVQADATVEEIRAAERWKAAALMIKNAASALAD